MMKMSGRPVSSPGRVEKYPPPLMRFLRSKSNGGSRSRSRGRSRSSPMFIRQKKSSAATVETKEPSSPKVTCMGQVRVRRSKQLGSQPAKKHWCKWFRNALLCHPFAGELKTRSCSTNWRKCVSFFRSSSRRKSKSKEDSPRSEPGLVLQKEREIKEEDEDERENPNVSVSPASLPPRNAFLLTRSRSAPYRSSSLACRFWGSPLADQDETKGEKDERQNREEDDGENPKSKRESLSRESDHESGIDSGTDRKIDGLCEFAESATKEEDRTEQLGLGFLKPLTLTRCKSEPARIGEKLMPEMGFQTTKKRLGFS